MPQMAPMSWTILMISFAMIMIAFSCNNYWIKETLPQSDTKLMEKKSTNWKW
uniref:ATP synthase complex subunit 8 n=1 Tax=Melittomma sp. MEL01 TaxID=1205634 RepID=A0A0S2MPN7_9CUCU|nr:ATP synthase F0 subunit 8 [Melittomma sp. MEL01]